VCFLIDPVMYWSSKSFPPPSWPKLTWITSYYLWLFVRQFLCTDASLFVWQCCKINNRVQRLIFTFIFSSKILLCINVTREIAADHYRLISESPFVIQNCIRNYCTIILKRYFLSSKTKWKIMFVYMSPPWAWLQDTIESSAQWFCSGNGIVF
jgi:hypothetical protein